MDWAESLSRGNIIQADGGVACGVGLLFVGKPGQGKTTLAAVLAQHLVRTVPADIWNPINGNRASRPVYFSSYPEILRTAGRSMEDRDSEEGVLLRSMFGESRDPVHDVKVLFIDDLGKEHKTQSGWAENLFDHLLRRRYDLGLPTVITTNVPLSEWSSVYGGAMASFAHEAFTASVIIAPGGDRRL